MSEPVVEIRADEHQPRFKWTTDVNPDTRLLAEMLQAAWNEVVDDPWLSWLSPDIRTNLAWYRVAERAKELRA